MQATFTEVVDVVTLAPALPETTGAGIEARQLVVRANTGDLKAVADGGSEVNGADGASGVEELAHGDGAAHISVGNTRQLCVE